MPSPRRAALLLLASVAATLAALPARAADPAAVVSVRGFGAAGDGATDDTAAIQRAIDAVGRGGTVIFPPGTYRLTQVVVGSRTALVGAAPGAVTLSNAEPAGRNFSGIVTNAGKTAGDSDLEIRNLTFERTVETEAFDEHVYLENCQRVVIENSRFVGRITRARHAQKGVHLRGCRYARILNNVFEDIPDNALALNGLDAATTDGHHVVIGNVFVRASSDPGAQIIVTQSNVTVVANAFHGRAAAGAAGHWIETGAAAGGAITGLSLTANTVRGFASLIHDVSGLVAVGNALQDASLIVDAVDAHSRDVAFVGNLLTGGGFLRAKRADHVIIEGNLVTGSAREGISVQDASHVSVIGNRVRRSQRSGVIVDGTTGPAMVAGNACYDNGQAGAPDAWFGLIIQGVAEATVTGNVCYDTEGAAATQRHGIAINATRTLTLRDNVAHGNRLGAYRELSPPAAIRRSGNVFDGAADGTPIARRMSATWSPPRLSAGAQTTLTVSVPGAEPGDPVAAAFSHDLRGLQLTAYVGSKNSVTAVLRNGTPDVTTLNPGWLTLQIVK